ncbi:AMP-binding protein [Boseongicola sp. H5]|uniref:AMP-binding protein n=1 Tax=Boseongicola sp. H5 TaxID=2763261 RepID=UPI00336AACE7
MNSQRITKSVEAHASTQGASPALSWSGNELSYGHLWGMSLEMLKGLPAGIDAGSLVLVESQKTPQFIALMIALGLRELTPLVVPARLGGEVRAKIIARAAATHAVTLMADGELNWTSTGQEEKHPEGDNPALCLTTSGSTGVPKVVRLTAMGIGSFFDWAQSYFGIQAGVRTISIAPLNFDLSLLEVWAALDAGAEVILADPERSIEQGYLASLCEAAAPEIVQAIPLFHDRLCSGLSPSSCFRPRHLIVTGEASAQELRADMAAQFPEALFHNVYGSTETNDSFILSTNGEAFAGPAKIGIGTPIGTTTFRIYEEPESPGTGELLTATPFAASGYSDVEQTQKAFAPEFENGRLVTYFRTGDRVRTLADGSLDLIGRADFVVKLRGVRTNLLDVEDVICLQASVLEAVTVPFHDLGAAQQQLLAVIVTDPDAVVNTLQMRAHCALHLPQSALPSRYVLTHEPLPKTSTGKVSRSELKRKYTPKPESNA